MSQLALTLGGYDVSDDTSGIDPAGFKITDLTKLQPSDIINAIIPIIFHRCRPGAFRYVNRWRLHYFPFRWQPGKNQTRNRYDY